MVYSIGVFIFFYHKQSKACSACHWCWLWGSWAFIMTINLKCFSTQKRTITFDDTFNTFVQVSLFFGTMHLILGAPKRTQIDRLSTFSTLANFCHKFSEHNALQRKWVFVSNRQYPMVFKCFLSTVCTSIMHFFLVYNLKLIVLEFAIESGSILHNRLTLPL